MYAIFFATPKREGNTYLRMLSFLFPSLYLLPCRLCNAYAIVESASLLDEIQPISIQAAGNEAYKSGNHAEAVEHYTAAISCCVESRPFTAICFCNRAAAYRSMGQLLDAIADCCLAIALDGNYYKVCLGPSEQCQLFQIVYN